MDGYADSRLTEVGCQGILCGVGDAGEKAPERTATSTDEQVRELGKLLDAELVRQLGPQLGCWPLVVGAAGVLLGLVLLFERL